jgi:protein-L-isoaspartate(D-aspartate) O-methyltransferase
MTARESGDRPANVLSAARQRMIDLLHRRIRDTRVLEAMAAVPREEFVPAGLRFAAYDDRALPIPAGQTISQPLIVALMLEAAELTKSDHVLEVGTGSGYQAAVLSRLAASVVTVERLAELTSTARRRLAALGYANVCVFDALETTGWPDGAPYDAIIVAAAAPHVPRDLIQQLATGGRLIVPVGDRMSQELLRVRRTPHGTELERLGPCAFVPLIGKDAWPAADVSRASGSLKVE